ncbi:MAG: nucleotide exchange factor GrpE [Chlamydiota bacterium]
MEKEPNVSEVEETPEPVAQEDFKQKYFFALAEMENMRKRMQKEKQDTLQFSVENAIAEFLPIIDSFEKALKSADKVSDEIKTWAFGFQMFLSQFREVLHNHGIVAFHSEGNLFDPHYHEAVEMLQTDEYPEGTILEEFSKGYKSEKRIIRPSRVKVAKTLQETSESSVNEQEINKEKNHDEE